MECKFDIIEAKDEQYFSNYFTFWL